MPGQMKNLALATWAFTITFWAWNMIGPLGIRYATDLQALWFMRGEVMQLLARNEGEAAAREKIDELSSLFADMLPSGLRSRPSPLSPSYRNSRPPEDYRTSRPHSDDT